MTESARILVWADAGQAAMIRAGVAASNTQLAGIGSSDPDVAAELANQFEIERIADLRQAIHREDIDLLWLAGREIIEREERKVIRERNLKVVSNEPIPGLVSEIIRDPLEARTAHFVPLMRHAPGIRHGLELREQFRGPRMVSIAIHRPPEVGSLFACLYDAMDLLAAFGLTDAVSSVDAAFIGSSSTPDLPADLEGSMTLHLRMMGGSSATITASNQDAGPQGWLREVRIHGAGASDSGGGSDSGGVLDSGGGWMRMTDVSCESWDSAGELLDSFEHPQLTSSGGGSDSGVGGLASGGGLIGIQMSRILEGLDAGKPPPDMALNLALCEAARLSCRTGQGESPGKILAMLKGP